MMKNKNKISSTDEYKARGKRLGGVLSHYRRMKGLSVPELKVQLMLRAGKSPVPNETPDASDVYSWMSGSLIPSKWTLLALSEVLDAPLLTLCYLAGVPVSEATRIHFASAPYDTFGAIVRRMRTAGKSNVELAELMGIPTYALYRISGGSRMPNTRHFVAIADGLGMTGEKLLMSLTVEPALHPDLVEVARAMDGYFPSMLRKARVRKFGKTHDAQLAAARHLGMSSVQYAGLENGTVKPTASQVRTLASFVGVGERDLMVGALEVSVEEATTTLAGLRKWAKLANKVSSPENIRDLRESLGVSLSEVSRSTGLHRTTIMRAETVRELPADSNTLVALATFYEVPLESLLSS